MADSVQQQIAILPTLPKTELRALWQELFESDPNPKIRRPAMIKFLMHRVQERAYASLSAKADRRLRQLNQALGRNPNSELSIEPRVHPGTRLLREWRGQVHTVEVGAKGYEYRGVWYRSLSEVARLITGTRWSGPLFFGTKKNPSTPKAQEAR